MLFSIHPGVWAAFATLTTGIAVNVTVFSAYQAKPLRLDWNNIPKEIRQEGGYKGNDPTLRKLSEIYKRWGTSVLWYLFSAQCPKDKPDRSEAQRKHCEQHRIDFWDAPEVLNSNATMEELEAHYKKMTAKD
ncbi:hypothetical protein MHLP_04355 [Candidatus Mycoplasma haematolamae str. Purdue]|uniref:Uncharacterized protein n=1 Tax=Mycoplasma haematolamae (strain Purdue) TaxID=1212765 RepID=I7CH17_MYCHA|nr:hypothetical protein [Candidatus Mycoplasma haematolamae]AFO52451.1 hypothetical protein MHLP_04355 [Candidatus Mycoplasma haematolamae str. Purdue]